MKIVIDTDTDSKEDIRKAIDLLQNHLYSDPNTPQVGSSSTETSGASDSATEASEAEVSEAEVSEAEASLESMEEPSQESTSDEGEGDAFSILSDGDEDAPLSTASANESSAGEGEPAGTSMDFLASEPPLSTSSDSGSDVAETASTEPEVTAPVNEQAAEPTPEVSQEPVAAESVAATENSASAPSAADLIASADTSAVDDDDEVQADESQPAQSDEDEPDENSTYSMAMNLQDLGKKVDQVDTVKSMKNTASASVVSPEVQIIDYDDPAVEKFPDGKPGAKQEKAGEIDPTADLKKM